MLDPDISTTDARRLLSQPAHRRRSRTARTAGRGASSSRPSVAASSAAQPSDAFGGQFGLHRLGFDDARGVRGDADRRHTTGSSSTSCCTAATTVSTRSSRTRTASTTTCGPANGNLGHPGRAACCRSTARYGFHPSLSVHEAVVGRESTGDRPRRRVPESRSVALHVDGDLDERTVRRGLGQHRLDRSLARWSTRGDSRSHGGNDRFVGTAASARRRPPRGSGAGERF